MSLIARMLSRMIFIRFSVILLGLSAFVLTLEVVGFLTEILKINSNALVAVGYYCLARLPGVLTLFLPTSLLLSLLLAITELSYRNELAAIWATGISPARLIVKLLPLALGIGILQFLFMNWGVPAAAPLLHSWGIGDYATRKFATAENEPVWIRIGNDIMRAERATADGGTLFDLILFRREATGQLRAEVFADKALQSNGHWLLNNVTTYYASGATPKREDQAIYDGPMRLANKKLPSPEEMSLGDLSTYIANNGFGVRPAYVYQTYWLKRLTPIAIAIVMLTLCVPLGTNFRRGGGLGLISVAGVGLGFAYFVGDGVAMTLGETGAIAPWLAAWGPILIFAAIAIGLLARTDHV